MTVPVGVNLLWLRPGEVGGSEEYLVRQLSGLAELRHEFVLTLYVLPTFAAAHPQLAADHELAVAPMSGRRRPIRVLTEATWLAAEARRRGQRFVHHGGGTMPAIGSVPGVLTVHDLQYLTYPQFVSGAKRAFLRAMVPRSVRRARVVCVPSDYVKRTIVDAFGIDPARIVVVPNAAGAGFVDAVASVDRAATDPTDAAADRLSLAELRARYALPERFVVYPAVTWPHKNHEVLLRALARPQARAAGLGAVLLGGEGPSEAAVHSLVVELGLEDRVVRPGRVPDRDRDALYEHAVALAFPSRYEGFGVPVLEAMAAGCPVVASNATALPEVIADAGLLVAPDDVDGWCAALVRLAGDPAERARLATAGRLRAATFTPRRSAEALLTAYRLVPVVSR